MQKWVDEWDGSPLGSDGAKPEKPMKRGGSNSNTALVRYFKDLTVGISMTLAAPVNGPALMKIFKNLNQKGINNDDIKRMIDLFVKEIKQTPLPSHVTPWRGFAARLDDLHRRIGQSSTTYDYSDYSVDPRLQKGDQ